MRLGKRLFLYKNKNRIKWRCTLLTTVLLLCYEVVQQQVCCETVEKYAVMNLHILITMKMLTLMYYQHDKNSISRAVLLSNMHKNTLKTSATSS